MDFNTENLGGHPYAPNRETEVPIWLALRAALEQLQETVGLPTVLPSRLVLLAVEPARPEHRSAVLRTGPNGGYHLQLLCDACNSMKGTGTQHTP